MVFNGLIRTMGRVARFDGRTLNIAADIAPNLGDSVAVNGACLSVVAVQKGAFSVEVSSRSAGVLALENYAVNKAVHLEQAMRLGERIDGHLVQGHIDGVGKIIAIKKAAVGTEFSVQIGAPLLPFISPKGSIAVEGVSLTVGDIVGDIIKIAIIPITLKDTLFGSFEVGRRVQIETDMMARYAARILGFSRVGDDGAGAGGKNAAFSSALDDKNEAKLTHEKADFYAAIY